MNRGLTLIELLVALALLSSVALAAVAWTQTALRTGAASAERIHWETAARAALALVADELACGDSPADEQPRVAVEGTAIAIRGRGLADQERYQWWVMVFDPRAATVSLASRVADGRGVAPAAPPNPHERGDGARLLLRDVANATWTFDDGTRVLTIQLESTTGQIMSRSFRAP